MRQLAELARFGDVMSADALVAFLALHEISAHVDGADPLSLGLGGRVRVIVAEDDLRRARWMLDSADLSDSEAWWLATGELNPSAARRELASSRAPESQGTRRIALRVGAIALAVLGVLSLLAR